MATKVETAPASSKHAHGEDPFDCPAFRMLSGPLQEETREKPHLWEYMHTLELDEIGVPEYTPTLGRAHKELTNPNVVYPSGKMVYIHVYPDEEDARDRYVAIEPTKIPTLAQLIPQVDMRLVHVVDEIASSDDPEVRTMALLDSLEKVVSPVEDHSGHFKKWFKRDGQLKVTPAEYLGLRYMITGAKVAWGRWEP